MLPASNRGAGMNIGMPDVCLTPSAPAPIPVPYPNMAMNAMAAPFSPIVKITGMPALNLGSKIPLTNGDEGGVAHPSFKQAGAYTMGNPVVFIDKQPGICLGCPTTGNNMNNPSGAVLVPSATNVFYTRRGGAPGRLDAAALEGLADAVGGCVELEAALLEDGVAHVRLAAFGTHAPARLHAALAQLGRDRARPERPGDRARPERPGDRARPERPGDRIRAVVLDLRANPGGDVAAACDLAGDFLPEGAVVARVVDGDGDEALVHARRGGTYPWPAVVIVDGATASAAEIFAGCLQHHRRAVVVGERTYGKSTAQTVTAEVDCAAPRYATVARYDRPDGAPIDGVGITPDIEVPPALGRDAPLDAALGELRRTLGAPVEETRLRRLGRRRDEGASPRPRDD